MVIDIFRKQISMHGLHIELVETLLAIPALEWRHVNVIVLRSNSNSNVFSTVSFDDQKHQIIRLYDPLWSHS